jgi:flagellar M-ring protein FliF
VVNLVASSIEGLDPAQVTVADATGKVLSVAGDGNIDGGNQDQMIDDVQDEYRTKLQTMLDRVLGPGNSTVQVIAALDFDDSVVETKDYTFDPTAPPRSQTTTTETYNGLGSPPAASGVVGPDGQMDPTTTDVTDPTAQYSQGTNTQDNVLNERHERRVSSPGALASLHIGVALDAKALTAANISLRNLNKLVNATAGVDEARGDTVSMNQMVFDRTAEKADAAALAKADATQAAATQRQQFKDVGLAVLVALLVLGAAFTARRRAKKRTQATTYLVEQLRQDQEDRITSTQVMELPPAALALEEAEHGRGDDLRREIDDLIERQPGDVASLLRGWLAERP